MTVLPRLLALCLADGLTAAAASAQPIGCGDGLVDPDAGETCDEGLANGASDSCCTETCTLRGADETCRPLGTGWTYANGGQVLPLIQGITKTSLRGKLSHPGLYTIAVTGKKGSYAVASDALPVTTTLVLDPPFATTGQCVEIGFLGLPGCIVTSSGTLVCK